MKLRKPFVLCFFSLLLITHAFAQSRQISEGGIRISRTTVHFSFTGANSLQQVDSLSAEMYAIPEVTEFKPAFKPGNKHAEITLVVVEKFPNAESPNTFDATRVKYILSKHGYNLESVSEFDSGHKKE
ncbi:MAG TPA: hypothetical protein VGO45_13835 [Bacteroidia bacterium]|jgi:hypothetical protein|nr:hypothetical protein [Bacteroidia bacterium]